MRNLLLYLIFFNVMIRHLCVLLMNLGRLENSGEMRDTKHITSNEWR